MPKIVYALYDNTECELHLFSADDHILAKDSVSAFLMQNVIPHGFHKGMENEDAQSLLNQVGQTTGIKQLTEILVGWDYELQTLLV